ncbi:glycoside hydrolase family 31 protein [Aquimarina agarilytica]|uniref:glycoside hydrolase family 31 protein n=1 Tax=Aquimarina agarilytica TaxID=1087449 RepID=UPI0002895C87|nr:glycoside hydrolase family 31 protein [Aquimarina agarilytica]
MILNEHIERKGNMYPSKVFKHEKDIDTFFFHTENGVILQLTVLRDSVVRFRYTTTNTFEDDFSYAIDKKALNGYNSLGIEETEDSYIITTEKIAIHILKSNLKVTIYDIEDDSIILQDEQGFHWEESYELGSDIVKMSKISADAESFYALGDKPLHSNLKGKRVENWATDSYAFGSNTDPIYKAIPFYVALHHKKAYGVFFDNTFRSYFDFCHERRNVTSFWAQGGEMNYYFIYGPKMEDVVVKYTQLTGVPEMPPMWALGFHQCKWSYYPEAKVKEITGKFRELNIPCDAIYLDIDYMDGFRCFTWDKDKFPDPKRMVKELSDDGFKTVVIIDPGIKIDYNYDVFLEGLENDYYCKRADGPYMKGKVWPGECYFPDYTRPEVREWWATLFKGLIEEVGVRGVWNDMNEPAVMDVPGKSFPNDVRHDYDGHPCSHRKAHNIYGMQMARATYHGVKRAGYPTRPFVITRSAYSGTQRYTSTWMGDNVATWEHLVIANRQIQRMCMSGYSFSGTDIGGFAEQPQGELFARWIQLGIFHPFFRVHSSGDHGEQEPWSFGDEITNITRKFIEIRYTLLPYIYTAFYNYIEEGVPMLKSLVIYDQEDVQTHYRTDEFIFGNQILVCPINEPNTKGRRMYIPKGIWFDFWSNTVIKGGKEYWVDADLDSMPIFVKSGAIIPRYPIQQFVGEKNIEELVLDCYYTKGIEKSYVYEDENDGYGYKKGVFSKCDFIYTGKNKEITIQQFKTGKYKTSYQSLKIRLIGSPFKIKSIELDNQDFTPDISYNDGIAEFVVPKDFTELHVLG